MSEGKTSHTASCLEIEGLLERLATEEPVESTDREALDRHLSTCMDCSQFSKILFGMTAFADSFAPEEARAVKAAVASLNNPPRQNPRRHIAIAAAATIVSVAAAAALLLLLNQFEGGDVPATRDASQPACAATAPVTVAQGVFMSSCEDTSAHVVVEDQGVLRVSLDRGAVGLSVDPNRRNKHKVIVATSFGEVWVKGTVLTVYVTNTDTRVDVFRGQVEVRPNASTSKPVEVNEGRAALLSEPRPFAPKTPWGESLRSRLEQIEDAPKPTFESEPPETTKDIDTDEMPALLSTAGEKNQGEADGFQIAPRVPSAEDLIQDAQLCLIDKDWNKAAALYRQIIRDYPSKPESESALISLAKIELRRLDRPEKALRYFNAYKTRVPGGPLTEEAILGIAESHRRLGNSDKEAAALSEFFTRFPKSTSTPAAKARLREISAD
jgi:ferric-dicitrate binding protein FerR (iron transport regulator)